jgi:hypothetical protein
LFKYIGRDGFIGDGIFIEVEGGLVIQIASIYKSKYSKYFSLDSSLQD